MSMYRLNKKLKQKQKKNLFLKNPKVNLVAKWRTDSSGEVLEAGSGRRQGRRKKGRGHGDWDRESCQVGFDRPGDSQRWEVRLLWAPTLGQRQEKWRTCVLCNVTRRKGHLTMRRLKVPSLDAEKSEGVAALNLHYQRQDHTQVLPWCIGQRLIFRHCFIIWKLPLLLENKGLMDNWWSHLIHPSVIMGEKCIFRTSWRYKGRTFSGQTVLS